MDNISKNFNTLSKCKTDIKNAIEQHDIIVDVPITGYADKIRSIDIISVPCVFYPGTKFSDSTFKTTPVFDTSEFTDMRGMFYKCYNLKNVYLYDTSNVTDMSYMFAECTSLKSIPELDTSNVNDISGMFSGCINFTSLPELDTSNVTVFGDPNNYVDNLGGTFQARGMFENCSSLMQIPNLNTSNGQYFSKMFAGCTNLKSIPELDTSNAIAIDEIFYNCSSLESLPLIDCSSLELKIIGDSNLESDHISPTKDIVKGCTNLTYIGGFKDLGKNYPSTSNGEGQWLTIDILDLSSCAKLTTESINNVINNLYDRVNAEYEGDLRIIFSKDSEDKFTTTMTSNLINKGYYPYFE